nr:MAG TPA: hypothetical protein [Caudoviricetes sp.]
MVLLVPSRKCRVAAIRVLPLKSYHDSSDENEEMTFMTCNICILIKLKY